MHYKLLCTKYPMNIASDCLKSTAPSKRRPNALQVAMYQVSDEHSF